MTETEGLLVIDKPGGMTSHDVVARVRRLAGTRKVGHAGTLDPMATGVLVLGLGRATRLLGYLSGHDKDYDATIRLGATTTTDDAEGEVLSEADARHVTDTAVAAAIGGLVGDIQQIPAAVSAVKVDGQRAYRKVRAGESVQLAARPVHVATFEVLARRGDELEVHVRCSAGTYVRALARDLGASLGVGAHLTALRRTRSGSFDLAAACSLDELADGVHPVPLAAAAAAAFARWDADAESARRLGLGQRLSPVGLPGGPVAAFGPDGALVALVEERDGAVRPDVVFDRRDMS